MSELRHHKTGRLIGNVPVCTDEFGTLWFRCQYTKNLVSCDVAIMLGAVVPQVTHTFVCAPDALEAFRASKREFDALDRNCNTCRHFVREKHEKSPYGFLKGRCASEIIPSRMVYDKEGLVYWIHPDDCMNLSCWEVREKNERLQDRNTNSPQQPPAGNLRAGKKAEARPQRTEDHPRKDDREHAQAVRGRADDQRVETEKVSERWIVIDGSIFTENEYEQKTAAGKFIKVRRAIAFNVGKETAQHIVNLHNEQNDYARRVGQLLVEQATAHGWKQGDPEDAFMFMMRRCREVAIEDAAPAAWNKFIRHLNETEPLLPKYKVEKGERVMVSSEPHRAFLGSVEWYRQKFFDANS